MRGTTAPRSLHAFEGYVAWPESVLPPLESPATESNAKRIRTAAQPSRRLPSARIWRSFVPTAKLSPVMNTSAPVFAGRYAKEIFAPSGGSSRARRTMTARRAGPTARRGSAFAASMTRIVPMAGSVLRTPAFRGVRTTETADTSSPVSMDAASQGVVKPTENAPSFSETLGQLVAPENASLPARATWSAGPTNSRSATMAAASLRDAIRTMNAELLSRSQERTPARSAARFPSAPMASRPWGAHPCRNPPPSSRAFPKKAEGRDRDAPFPQRSRKSLSLPPPVPRAHASLSMTRSRFSRAGASSAERIGSWLKSLCRAGSPSRSSRRFLR